MYPFYERQVALDAAVALLVPTAPTTEQQADALPQRVVACANVFLGWLSGARLVLSADPLTYAQGNPALAQATRYAGGNVQLTDTQQVTLSVEPEDSKGFATSDTLTWSSSDDTVISLQPSADTLSCLCVAGNPGTGITVTVTDGTISASDNFDVVAGNAASLVISEGTPEAQPAAG